MDMELEKERTNMEQEKAKMYIQYLSNIFSQPLQEKPSQEYLRAKKEFENMITPQIVGEKEKEINRYEWDFDPQKYIEMNE